MYFIVDLEKCVGCFNCMVACKDEHVGNCWLPYTDRQQKHEQKWINPVKHERGTAPFTEMCFVNKLCQHCKNAPCEKAAPVAVKRLKSDNALLNGIVLLDAEKAKGNKALVDACPYGNISWNEELNTAQKCTMCAHLIEDGWREPRCVQACPLRAISVVSCGDEEFEDMIAEQQLETLTDIADAPRVMYRNLYKLTTCFVAGALAYSAAGTEKAAVDAVVRLQKNGEVFAEAKTDFFGEFKIDRIPKNSGAYDLLCSFKQYAPLKQSVVVDDESPCLDVMMFV